MTLRSSTSSVLAAHGAEAHRLFTWHIATSSMEVDRYPQTMNSTTEGTTFSRVAIALSSSKLIDGLSSSKLIDGPTLTPGDDCSKLVRDGVKLGKFLMTDEVAANKRWNVLADVWMELVIYLAPSSEEERVMGHAEGALVQGSEFSTVLWALTTHTSRVQATMFICKDEERSRLLTHPPSLRLVIVLCHGTTRNKNIPVYPSFFLYPSFFF